MDIIIDKGCYKPTRAHETDAGYDLRTPIDFILPPNESAVIDTGVHIKIPNGCVGMLKSKSGLNVKNGIIGEGVIDAGYTGSITVKLYNFGRDVKEFQKGDKIIQLVIIPFFAEELNEVESFPLTERGNNGFGSSGR